MPAAVGYHYKRTPIESLTEFARLLSPFQLPEGLPIYGVEDIPMKRADKKFTDSIGQVSLTAIAKMRS